MAISYATRETVAKQVVAEIKDLGRKAMCVACDVSQPQQVNEMVAATRDALGPIELVAHCGAISNIADHSEMTYELWRETIDVNLNGAFLVINAVKDEMIQHQFGRIVMISSIAALRPRKMQMHYSAAKAGVIALTRCCSEGFAPHNVRINCVAPSLTETEMAHVLSEETIQTVLAARRWGVSANRKKSPK